MGDFVEKVRNYLPFLSLLGIIVLCLICLGLFLYMKANLALLMTDPCSMCMDQIHKQLPIIPYESIVGV
jgi:hypothetical protein